MKRIGKIIECCNECEHSERYFSQRGNHGCVFICKLSNKLILRDDNKNHTHSSDEMIIPDWCTLPVLTPGAIATYYKVIGDENENTIHG